MWQNLHCTFSQSREHIWGIVVQTSVKTKLSPCLSFVFRVGWEGGKHLLFIKSNGFKWFGFQSLTCFQLLDWAVHGRKSWTVEMYGGRMYRAREGEEEWRNWNEGQGEMKIKEEEEVRGEREREKSPTETIGLDREREREQRRECLINGLFI